MKNLVMCLIVTLLLGGCASKYAVTFDSSPQGATLICNGTNWGQTPKTLYYDKSVKEQSTLNLGRCSANWVSGAKKTYGVIPVTQYPDGVRQTLQRPNVANASVDYEVARRQKQEQREANARASAEFANAMQDLGNSFKQAGQQFQQNANSYAPTTNTYAPSNTYYDTAPRMYNTGDCLGPVVAGVCKGIINPSAQPEKVCLGVVVNGSCSGPSI